MCFTQRINNYSRLSQHHLGLEGTSDAAGSARDSQGYIGIRAQKKKKGCIPGEEVILPTTTIPQLTSRPGCDGEWASQKCFFLRTPLTPGGILGASGAASRVVGIVVLTYHHHPARPHCSIFVGSCLSDGVRVQAAFIWCGPAQKAHLLHRPASVRLVVCPSNEQHFKHIAGPPASSLHPHPLTPAPFRHMLITLVVQGMPNPVRDAEHHRRLLHVLPRPVTLYAPPRCSHLCYYYYSAVL
mmetsp:Transcript_18820/g.29654  ORF Transcript_18820/g.29654 Transcript_18820/m.29654 type:complete len:241 (-) Transcript_18820:89-811(-)